MARPPMSEIFEAMAEGVMAPYMPAMSQQILGGGSGGDGGMSVGPTFDGNSFDRAREQAAMYRAIAAVYRKYEQAHPDSTEGGDAADG